MKNKNKLLSLKLKGELNAEDIFTLEDFLAKNLKSFNGINFDLTGLTFMDSSGIGFLINQYSTCIQNNKQINFHINNEKIEINTKNDILKLCEQILSKPELSKEQIPDIKQTPDIIKEKQNNIQDQNAPKSIVETGREKSYDIPPAKTAREIKIVETETTDKKQDDIRKTETISQQSFKQEQTKTFPEESVEKKPVELIDNKKSVVDPVYFENQEETNKPKTRPPLIERYRKGDEPGRKGIYNPGIIFSFLIILSLFIPLFIQGKVITSWHFLSKGANAIPVWGVILSGVIILIISVIPSLNMYNRSPALLLLGALGIALLVVSLNKDMTFHSTFSSFLIYKKSLFYLAVLFVFTGTVAKFISKNPENRIAVITLGILIFIVMFMYLYPFIEYKRIILTGLKSRVLLKDLAGGLKSSGFTSGVLKIYMLLPVFFVFLSVFLFFKPAKFTGLANIVGTGFLIFFPVLIFFSMFYAGLKTKAILFPHIGYLLIQLSVFSYFFNQGFLYTFFLSRMAGYYHIIPTTYTGYNPQVNDYSRTKKKQFLAVPPKKPLKESR